MKHILLLASLAVSSAVVAGEQFPDNQRAQARLREEKERDAKAQEYREKTDAQIESDRKMALEFAEQDARKARRQRVEKLEAEFGWKKAQADQEQQEKVAGDAPGKNPIHPCSYILSRVFTIDDDVAADTQDQKREAEQQSAAPKKKKRQVSRRGMQAYFAEVERCLTIFLRMHGHQVRILEKDYMERLCMVCSHYPHQVHFALSDFGRVLHGVIETAHAEGDIPDNVMARYRRVIQDPIHCKIKERVLEEFGYDSPDDADEHASKNTLAAMAMRMFCILVSHAEYAVEFFMMKDEIFRYLFQRLPQRVQAQPVLFVV